VASVNKRVYKLRRLLDRNKIDGVFISQAENRRYLSGFDGTAGYLLITATKAVLATDFRYTEQAAREAPDFEILRIVGNIVEWFPGLLADSDVKRLGFESASVTFSFFRQLQDALKRKGVPAKLVPVTGIVESLRAVKEPAEIGLIRKASALTDAAFNNVTKKLKPGMTEAQIAWELEKSMRESGSQALPFEIIIASGPNAALPHHKPDDRAIESGEPVVIDMGAKVGGYATDLSRTVCAGLPGSQFKKVYHIVYEAQQAAISKVRAGMTGHEADAIARNIIKKAGYGEAFGHALGHGVGLEEHESPRLGPGSRDKLVNGMVFTIEPGIYLPGWGGVRIEDTVVMEKGQIKLLTGARKESY
jgi:Xaa-Pro aminopeptidase